MREILFRGKRTDTGEWVYGYLVKHPSAIQIGEDNPWYINVPPVDPDDNGGVYNVDPATVGQYTGLTDKNGVKIFEGDIVESRASDNPADWKLWLVQWDDGCFEFSRGTPRRKKWHHEMNVLCKNEIDFFGLIVVGNIYDNPELLEVQS